MERRLGQQFRLDGTTRWLSLDGLPEPVGNLNAPFLLGRRKRYTFLKVSAYEDDLKM